MPQPSSSLQAIKGALKAGDGQRLLDAVEAGGLSGGQVLQVILQLPANFQRGAILAVAKAHVLGWIEATVLLPHEHLDNFLARAVQDDRVDDVVFEAVARMLPVGGAVKTREAAREAKEGQKVSILARAGHLGQRVRLAWLSEEQINISPAVLQWMAQMGDMEEQARADEQTGKEPLLIRLVRQRQFREAAIVAHHTPPGAMPRQGGEGWAKDLMTNFAQGLAGMERIGDVLCSLVERGARWREDDTRLLILEIGKEATNRPWAAEDIGAQMRELKARLDKACLQQSLPETQALMERTRPRL